MVIEGKYGGQVEASELSYKDEKQISQVTINAKILISLDLSLLLVLTEITTTIGKITTIITRNLQQIYTKLEPLYNFT